MSAKQENNSCFQTIVLQNHWYAISSSCMQRAFCAFPNTPLSSFPVAVIKATKRKKCSSGSQFKVSSPSWRGSQGSKSLKLIMLHPINQENKAVSAC